MEHECGGYRWRCSHCTLILPDEGLQWDLTHALDLESLHRQLRGPLCSFGRISLLATLFIKWRTYDARRMPEYYYFAGLPSGAMAGRRVVARRGKMACLCFFVNIYARIGDRATPAMDYESSCCFFRAASVNSLDAVAW